MPSNVRPLYAHAMLLNVRSGYPSFMFRRLIAASLLALVASVSFAQERVKDVIYAKRGGVALTMDVFKPAKPNGIGVIWIVSGGWVSSHEGINEGLSKPFTDKGITVFEVVHGAQPKYQIPEIVDQVQRAVRYIRANATTFGVKGDHLGICGASAGGHLSLMIGGLAGAGNPNSSDPVEKESAGVQAVVAYYPPTDFQHFGDGQAARFVGDPKYAIFVPAFGITKDTPPEKVAEITKKVSPILLANPAFPPTLLIHGDKDTLVPLQQSQVMDAALGKAGAVHQLIVVKGTGHDGVTIMQTLDKLVGWFLEKLK